MKKIRVTYRKILLLISTFLIITSLLLSVKALNPSLNNSISKILHEEDKIAYGVISGFPHIENHYIQAQYATDLRYVQEGKAVKTDSYDNRSNDFLSSLESEAYSSYSIKTYDDIEPVSAPTYIQGLNKTSYGPHINFTVGVEKMGYLPLDSRTAFTLEFKKFYVFKVELPKNSLYDLNIRSTSEVYCYVYDLSKALFIESYTIDGVTRKVQPIFSQTGGEMLLYFQTTEVDTDLIIEPRRLKVETLRPDITISNTFYNPPDQIWNETLQKWQDNRQKETIHTFYFELEPGTYIIKYNPFVKGVDTEANIYTDQVYYSHLSDETNFRRFSINTFYRYTVFHVFETTRVYAIITGQAGEEFDYLFSIKALKTPTFHAGTTYHYKDSFMYFKLNITSPRIIYINATMYVGGYFTQWTEDNPNKVYIFNYAIRSNVTYAEKILLLPGIYVFASYGYADYDGFITINEILPQTFSGSFDIEISQENYSPENYALLKINSSSADIFDTYNLTFSMQKNYTVDIHFDIYSLYSYDAFPAIISGITLGNQQTNQNFIGYPTNNTETLVLFSPEPNHVRYLLLSIERLYNNTEATWPDKGVEITNSTKVRLRLIKTDNLPVSFGNIQYIEKQLSVDQKGNADYFASFNDSYYAGLYVLKLKVPLLTWYDLDIEVRNGTYEGTYYTMPNVDNVFPGYVLGPSIWNKYYYDDISVISHIGTGDTSNISYVIWHSEFGILSEELVLLLPVLYVGLNGTLSVSFTAHNCTEILPLDLGVFESLPKTQNKTVMIVGIAAGSIVVLSTITVLVVKLVSSKKR